MINASASSTDTRTDYKGNQTDGVVLSATGLEAVVTGAAECAARPRASPLAPYGMWQTLRGSGVLSANKKRPPGSPGV